MNVVLGASGGFLVGVILTLGMIASTGRLDSNKAWGIVFEVAGAMWIQAIGGAAFALLFFGLSRVL